MQRFLRGSFAHRSPLKVMLVVLATLVLLVDHYFTPVTVENQALHDLHRHILYIPIILAAFWYGWRGGLLAAVAISLSYFPHFKHEWMGHHALFGVSRTFEALTNLAIGGGTGYLIDRLRREQKDLRQANTQLAWQSTQLREAMEVLTEKTREAFESEQQLRRADRLSALGQLTTGLAHEIRNPLASIRGAAEILGDAGTAPIQREEFSRILIEETERLDHVLSEFMDYARSQKAEGAETSDLPRTIEKISALLSRQIKEGGIVLTTTIPESLPLLAISENLLQQVLLNLMLNAIQAMPGGGKLLLEAGMDAKARLATIRISDTGPGIPRDQAEYVFDPFYTTKPQGTGLGLSIVHKIVSNYRGWIRVDPDYQGGACFVLTLPLA